MEVESNARFRRRRNSFREQVAEKITAITIVPEAELGYEIGSFTVNGVDRLTELSENGGEYWITIAEDVELTVTFTPLTGISGAKLTEVYFDRTTSILHAPEGAMWQYIT